jgi:hypothetical protein
MPASSRSHDGGLDVLERQEDDRVALEVRLRALGRRDGEAFEEGAAILGGLLEEAAQHREVERLAEAARPRQQHHLGVGADHRVHERRLVDVAIAILPQRAEVREPEGESYAGGRHGRMPLEHGMRSRRVRRVPII